MIRRRMKGGNAGALAVPLAMVDTWLLLVAVMAIEARFDVSKIPLPELLAIDKTEAVAEATPGLSLTVLSTGQVQYAGEPISIADVVARIQAEPDASRPIEVNIETLDGGQGNATAFLQLVRELSKAGVGNRVNVPVEELKTSE